MKLVDLNKEFIERSVRPIVSGLPIKVSNPEKLIIAVEKWKVDDSKKLNKKFMFESYDVRNRFIQSLLEHEVQLGHHASFEINELEVKVSLLTKDVGKITELDKEYAKYADTVRRDLVYKSNDEWLR
jgi:pterin-4a-carbinolamine dehydratase